jgi:protein HIRA/HIR1
MGHPIVTLQLYEKKSAGETAKAANVMMLVVTADGTFGVYRILPELGLEYKGSLMPAMTHMSLASFVSGEHRLPKVSRVQVTESGRLLLLLSLMHPAARNNATEHTPRGSARSTAPADGGVGGSLQAFVYDRPSELWMRISDSRFVLSDFYSSLPSARSKSQGVLARMDDAVRLGSLESSIKASHRGRLLGSDRHADGIYNQAEEDSGNYLANRSHCEDRMACALALGSASEFSYWLSMYARTLSVGGRGPLLRMLVDMLFGTKDTGSTDSGLPDGASACWWLSSAPQVLGLDRKNLVKTIVVPEMSKNRALQRITNEIALEVDSKSDFV